MLTHMKQIANQKIPKLRFSGFSDEWVEKNLSNLSVRIGDGIHATPIYDDQGDYFFVNGNNLINGKIVTYTTTKRVNSSEVTKHQRNLNSKTVLISINGTIGNVALYNNEKIILGKSACYLNLNENVNKLFIFYILQNNKIQKHFYFELTGTTIKNLSLKSIANTRIAIPTYPEQQKIASFLSSIDDWIENLKQQKAYLESYKKDMMRKIFSQEIHFKDDEGKDFPNWEEKLLGDITYNFDNLRKPISSEKRTRGIYPYYGANGVTDLVDGYIFEGEYILIAEDGVVDVNDYPIHIAKGKFWANNHAHVIQGKNINNLFMYYLLLNTKFRRYITGSAQTKLNGQVLSKIKVSVPNITEQQKIAAFLNSVDDLLSLKVNQIKLVENWKKGLIQQLFI
jgi:type I restriction enzyme S subunit